MRIIFSLIIFLLLLNTSELSAQYNKVIEKGKKLYLANTLVLKMKDASRQINSTDAVLTSATEYILQKEGMTSSEYLFKSSSGKLNDELRQIIKVEYSSNADPEVLSKKLSTYSEVEWCEPYFVYEIEYVPNDTQYVNQYYLTRIQAEQAWDVTQGDTSVIIAIVDTGVDWDHPDLAANMWINTGEIPGNGFDDDGNGYIDDVRGWDFGGLDGTPDNNPREDRPDHGTAVAGTASAVTDNITGIASIGFKSRLMAVKVSRDDVRNNGNALIVGGYQGVVYAADNGAKVINLSWGSAAYSVLLQEVIDYAVSQGALVVAAAGNAGIDEAHYPASYVGVLSVGSTGGTDRRSSFSSYGPGVDVSAPGNAIYTTWQDDTYTSISGTSFSSPLTAGLAALVTHQFPLFNPLQVAEQIRVNTDDIYSLNNNVLYLFGSGRINALKAVSNTASKSVRAVSIEVSDNAPYGDGDGIFERGETISVSADFVNFLNTIDNLSITLEALNSHSTILNGTFNAGQKGTLELFSNEENLFTIQINPVNVPENADLTFKLNYTDGSYTDFQVFRVRVNPSYGNQYNGEILLTIGNDGTLGFIDFPDNNQGSGFRYDDSDNLLFEGALMLGVASNRVSDAARVLDSRNIDFASLQPVVIEEPGLIADQEGYTIFSDLNADNPLGVNVHLNTYSYANFEDKDYIILKYTLENRSTTAINNLYAGLFFDWDFGDAVQDVTAFDAAGNLGYVYRNGGNPDVWVGTASVSLLQTGFHAIRNDGTQGTINLFDNDGFTKAEKWTTLTSGIAVPATGPGDISHVVSSGPYSIDPAQSVEAAFAIAGGYSLEELREAMTKARLKYENILLDASAEGETLPTEFSLDQNYPNPFNPSTRIGFSLPQQEDVMIRVFNILGEESVVLLNKNLTAGRYQVDFNPSDNNLAAGVYIYSIKAGSYYSVRKMIYLK